MTRCILVKIRYITVPGCCCVPDNYVDGLSCTVKSDWWWCNFVKVWQLAGGGHLLFTGSRDGGARPLSCGRPLPVFLAGDLQPHVWWVRSGSVSSRGVLGACGCGNVVVQVDFRYFEFFPSKQDLRSPPSVMYSRAVATSWLIPT